MLCDAVKVVTLAIEPANEGEAVGDVERIHHVRLRVDQVKVLA